MNINRYAKNFLNEIYLQSDKLYDISKLDNKEKQIINNIVANEYSYIFCNLYMKKQNKKVFHNPELATDFNIVLIELFTECIRMVFLCNLKINFDKKQEVFTFLVKNVEDLILDSDNSQKLTSAEFILYIKKKLRQEFNKLYPNNSIYLNSYRSLLGFLYNKYKYRYSLNKHYQKLSLEFNKIFPRNIFLIFLISLIGLIIVLIYHIENNYLTILILLLGILTPLYCINSFCRIEKKLENLKREQNIFKTYERLGIDVIKLEISPDLVHFFDNKKEMNIIGNAISDIRMELTDEYGFVLTSVRIFDNNNLKNAIKFFVRNKEVDFLEIKELQNDFPVDIFKNKLKNIILNNIDKILTIEETATILELNVLINDRKNNVLENKLDIYDIREIFVKIIQKGGSLIDFLYVYERINHYLKTTRNTEEIAELICSDMAKYKLEDRINTIGYKKKEQ